MRLAFVCGVTITCIALAGSPARADGTTAYSLIDELVSGWGTDELAVNPSAAVENPDSCTSPDLYQVSKSDTGGAVHIALLISAMVSGHEARFRLSGCTPSGRPRIIGVHARQP